MLCTILRSMDLAAAAGDDTDHKEGLIEVHVYIFISLIIINLYRSVEDY